MRGLGADEVIAHERLIRIKTRLARRRGYVTAREADRAHAVRSEEDDAAE
jgi:hypothetical protein